MNNIFKNKIIVIYLIALIVVISLLVMTILNFQDMDLADEEISVPVDSDFLIVSLNDLYQKENILECIIINNKQEIRDYLESLKLRNFHLCCCYRDLKYMITAINDKQIVNNNGVKGFPIDIPDKSGLYYNKAFENKSIDYIKKFEASEDYCYLYLFESEGYNDENVFETINEPDVVCVFNSNEKIAVVMKRKLTETEFEIFEIKYKIKLS